MAKVYSKPTQDSLCRTGLAVYRTDEKNFQPYVSSGVVQTASSDSSDDEDSSDKQGFTYHQGSILDSYYYANLNSTNHEYDYSDMSDSATVKVEKVNKKRYYKGVRLSLLKEWEAPGTLLTWNDLKPVINGFITEQTFSEDGVEIKVNGYSKLLDQKFTFEFSNMKRSKILAEIIKTAGLTPVINTKGLDDDVTSFSNKSESSSSSSSTTGGEGETIDNLVKKIIGNETDDLKKCKLVHGWLKDNVKYSGYPCSKYQSADECLKHKTALNCADTARLTRAMMSSAGLDAWVVHRSSNNGHFWTLIKINGKIYASDQTGSGSEFNTIWYSDGDRRTCDSKGGNWDKKNGKNPDC